MTKKTDSPN